MTSPRPGPRPCPDCGEPLGPRTEARHRGCNTIPPAGQATAKQPNVGPRPRLLDSCRLPVPLAMFPAAGVLLENALGDGNLTRPLLASAAGLLALGPLIHSGRVDAWERKDAERRVAARLALACGPGMTLRVQARHDRVPVKVKVTPGPTFTGQPDAVSRMAGAFAVAVGVDDHQVVVTRARGSYLLHVDEKAAPALAPVVQLHAVPDQPHDADQPAPTAVAARAQEALASALDDTDAEVQVLDWHDGAPTSLLLTYPPRVAPRALEKRGELVATMHALHKPAGDWFVRWQPEHDRYLIEDAPDPLAPHVPLSPTDPDPDLYLGVQIGLLEDGSPWRVPLMGGFHTLVAGATGAGKGSVLWSIIRALEPMIADGRVRLWIADPKGGIEFDRAEPFAYRFAVDQEDIAAMFTEASVVMSRKAEAQRGKGRKIEAPTRETPLDLVIIDEIAAVLGQAAMPDTVKACTPPVVKMLTQGRAPLFTVVAAVQDPRKENLRQRGLFTLAIALRLSEPGEVNLTLGSGVRAKGATADLIPEDLPGVGFMVRDSKAGVTRGRASFVSDDEIARIADSLLPPRPAPQHGPPVPHGEQLHLPEPPAGRPALAQHLTDGRRFTWEDDPRPAIVVGSPAPVSDEDFADLLVTWRYADESAVREAQVERADPVTFLR